MTMQVAFTICSNNYLAQASVLAKSFKQFNPDFFFAIILLDSVSDLVDYNSIQADEIIQIDALYKYNLKNLYEKYNIIELNTAVKPFVFKYFIEKFVDIQCLYYFDPDLKFFSDIKKINNQLAVSSIVITPHISSPIPMDGLQPQEPLFLNYGLYNLGFLGLNPNHIDSVRLLDWWGERTYMVGYDDVKRGLFVDQLWMNFAPLFFSDVTISFDFGLNMGPWNLHERSIKLIGKESIILNNDDVLIFYHFSSYNYLKPEVLSKHYNRYSFDGDSKLRDLYHAYHNDVIQAGIEKYHVIPHTYGKNLVKAVVHPISVKQKIKNTLRKLLIK